MSHSLICLLIKILMIVIAFLMWPFFIKKISQKKNLEEQEINQFIGLRWRYGLWFLIIFISFQCVQFF